MRATESEVLIVGAGPAGLVAALTLAQYGIESTVVERRPGTSSLPRATGVSLRTMELIRSWGLEPEVRAGEVDAHFAGWVGRSLTSMDGMVLELGFPSREDAALLSPTTAAIVPQDHLEPVLLRQVRAFGTVDTRFGTELVALDQNDAGVVARVQDRSSGAVTTLRPRFVIGADGAHSAVRRAVGITMEGPDQLQRVLTAVFHAPLWPLVGDRRYGIYMIEDGETPGLVLVPTGGDRWLYGRFLDPDGSDGEAFEDYPRSRIAALVRAAVGLPELHPRIERMGQFSFAAQVAQRYRDRSVFLVGDAAHRITPRGGTGMNTAIHDAYDLAWKLAWVLRGWSRPDLLDSYEAQRRPVGIRNTLRSATPTGDEVSHEQRVVEDLGGRLAHAWVRPGVSTLDLLGPGLTLLVGPEGWRWHGVPAAADRSAPLTVHALDGDVACELGLAREGALLVRPDGQVVERWPAEAAAAA